MSDAATRLWARTRLHVWPEPYLLVSLRPDALTTAAQFVGALTAPFAALVFERDEVSLTVPEGAWRASPLAALAQAESARQHVITFDLDLDLEVVGYLAPAAQRLAAAAVSIVPQCAFRKDHLLVAADALPRALEVLERLIAEARSRP